MSALNRYLLTYATLLLLYPLGIESQQEYYLGEACETSKGVTGKCEILRNCPSVLRDMLANILPENVCAFSGFDPVVCCPSVGSSTTTISSSTGTSTSKIESRDEAETERKTSSSSSRGTPTRGEAETEGSGETESVGQLASQKCAEFARAVYTLVPPPLFGDPWINTSLCAIKSKKLIVGGKNADPKEFPHMAAIGFVPPTNPDRPPVWSCGGSLVSDRFVLTAAHCTYSRNFGAATWVRLGDLDLRRNDDDARIQEIRIEEKIRHPDYRGSIGYHDIALLKLRSKAVFNAYTRPACLPIAEPNDEDEEEQWRWREGVAIGWGAIEFLEENGSDHLQKVTLNRVSQQSCNESYVGNGNIDSRFPRGIVGQWQICAGQLGRDTCQGDSGGPLAIFNTKHECMYDVVGITSTGGICGSVMPGIYTRVRNYVSWLEDTMWR